MTVDEIVDAALARGSEFGLEFPSARSVYYRRVAQRARELQAMLGRWNPALVSTDAAVAVSVDGIHLDALDVTELRAVLIEDAGTSDYEPGDTVNIIPPEDARGHLPPRVYFRGSTRLVPVGDDLAGVGSVRVFSTNTGAVTLAGGDTPITPSAYQELLVNDLTRFMAGILSTTPDANTSALVAILDTEQAQLLDAFEQFALNFASAGSSRFGRITRPSPTPGPAQ